MKSTMKVSTAVFAGVLSLSTMASTAEASSGTSAQSAGNLFAHCESGNNTGMFVAFYNLSSTGRPAFNRFTWSFATKTSGNKNNLRIRIRKDVNGGADKTLWQWKSRDNLRPGFGAYNPPVALQVRSRVHLDAKFVFDNPRGYDWGCTARTASV